MIRLCSLLFIISFRLLSQENGNDIKFNNLNLKIYSDSLQVLDQWLESGKINSTEYKIAIYRISSEMAYLTGNNVETTYPVVDSIIYSTMKDAELPTSNDEQPSMNSEENTSQDVPEEPMKIKMPLSARVVGLMIPNPERRTKLSVNLCFGATGILNNSKEFGYPEIDLLKNFYVHNLRLDLRTRLGRSNSKIGIIYGIGFDYVSLRQTEDLKQLQELNEKPVFASLTPTESEASIKLRLKYLRFPLGLDYKINKKVNLQVHGFYNLLLRQRQYVYLESDDDKKTIIDENKFGLNSNLIGMHYHIGFKRNYLFFEHSLNSILNGKADQDWKYFKIGIGFR
ncbi:MAG: hypothetical protein HOP11_01880 [Saprospiraceae bacterium]|nr:hypothetical protein [Saprospiraceae bacterium]